jgi:DNA-binding XRE family transcriptional regulator
MPGRSPARSSRSDERRPPNNLQRLREEQLLTKAELARKAGVSPLTVARVESGLECRVDTKRKIILALGLAPSDKEKVFGNGAVRKGGRSLMPRP